MKTAIIKPLVWDLSNAQSIVGTYNIGRTGGEWWVRLRGCEIAEGHAKTFEAAEVAAQSAAQEHYTAAILSAIFGNATPAPSDKIAEAALIDWLERETRDIETGEPLFDDAHIDVTAGEVRRRLAALRALAGKGE